MIPTSLKWFRIAGLFEGTSSVMLFGIAMPLKYFANLPMAVSIVGSLHGGLFLIYLAMAMYVSLTLKWGFVKMALAFVASVVPIGPFIFDAWVIREHIKSQTPESTANTPANESV